MKTKIKSIITLFFYFSYFININATIISEGYHFFDIFYYRDIYKNYIKQKKSNKCSIEEGPNCIFIESKNKNDIAIEYSQFTVPQGVYLIGGVFGAAFSLGNFSFDNTIFTGALGVEYNRNVNNWFSYGGYIGAEYITSDTYTMKDDVKTYNGGHYNLGFISIMPTCRFKWFTKEKIGDIINILQELGD